jgi:hypothetical protein
MKDDEKLLLDSMLLIWDLVDKKGGNIDQVTTDCRFPGGCTQLSCLSSLSLPVIYRPNQLSCYRLVSRSHSNQSNTGYLNSGIPTVSIVYITETIVVVAIFFEKNEKK